MNPPFSPQSQPAPSAAPASSLSPERALQIAPLLGRMLEEMGVGVAVYDPDGVVLYHNQVLDTTLFLHKRGYIGARVTEVFPPELLAKVLETNAFVLQTGQPLQYEVRDGGQIMQVNKRLCRMEAQTPGAPGQPEAILLVIRDITAQRQSERSLALSEHLHQALLEHNPGSVLLISPDDRIVYASPGSYRFAGFSTEEVVGTKPDIWLHPDDLRVEKLHTRDLRDLPGATINYEVRHLCKNGEWRWIEVIATNRLHDPMLRATVVNLHDIHARKVAEADLLCYKNIVTSSPNAVFTLDTEYRAKCWNPGAERLFGFAKKEMLGQSLLRIIPEGARAQWEEKLRKVRGGGHISDWETVVPHKNGRPLEVSAILSPIRAETGKITTLMLHIRDISGRRKLEKRVLEIADLEKERIGRELHDDLCQHLAAIALHTELLRDKLAASPVEAEQARQITQMAVDAGEHARLLAKGLAPASLLKNGLPAALENLARNIETLFRFPCRFENRVGAETPPEIAPTETAFHFYRIAQEAANNAAKHSRGTHSVIRLLEEPDAFVLEVEDDGSGLGRNGKTPGGGGSEHSGGGNTPGGGMGRQNMATRAAFIGAALEFRGGPNGGTRVVCLLPKKE